MEPIHYLGKTVGFLRRDKVYISERREVHIFRKYDGLGMSFSLLMKLKKAGCHKIVLILERNNLKEKFETSIDNFIKNGINFKFREFDNQKILSFKQLKKET